jgi:hypothetical protein
MYTTHPIRFGLLTLALGLSTQAAMAKDFTGPAISLGAGYDAISTRVTTSPTFTSAVQHAYGDAYQPASSHSSMQGSMGPMLDLSWGFDLGNRWIGTVGGNLEFGKRTGPETSLGWLNNGIGTLSSTFSMERHASLYASLGKRLAENWLLYGKLGYHQASGSADFRGGSQAQPSLKQTTQLTGVGGGVGVVRTFASGLELRMETEYISFSNYSLYADQEKTAKILDGKPTVVRMSILAGYRF